MLTLHTTVQNVTKAKAVLCQILELLHSTQLYRKNC